MSNVIGAIVQVTGALTLAKSEAEWNQICANIKRTHDGNYPSWWYTAVIRSGLAERKAQEFGMSGAIRVEVT